MSTDINILFELLTTLERISNKINDEVNQLKKKLDFSNIERELRKSTHTFYLNTLLPLFKSKEQISIYEILEVTERKKNTVLNYLSELCKQGYLKKDKNQFGDKRTKLYKLL